MEPLKPVPFRADYPSDRARPHECGLRTLSCLRGIMINSRNNQPTIRIVALLDITGMKSLFVVFFCLFAFVSSTQAQTPLTATSVKSVQMGDKSVKLVPPRGYVYLTDQPTADSMSQLMNGAINPRNLLFGFKSIDAPIILSGEAKRPLSCVYVTEPVNTAGRSITLEDFNRLKGFVSKQDLQSIANEPGLKKDAERRIAKYSDKNGVKLDSKKISNQALGVIGQGRFYIITGLLSRNATVTGKGFSYTTDYAILYAFVLVRNRIVTMTVCNPYKKEADLDDTKNVLTQWIADTIKVNSETKNN